MPTSPRVRGYANRIKGETLENIILAACRSYAEQGRALIDKTPEPMRPLKRLEGGRFIACFEKKAQPDFKGAVSGGRAIAFEAKCTDGDEIRQSCVTDEQAKVLSALDRLGADCFVLVSFGFRSFARIPWATWSGMKRIYGRKYITEEEAAPFRVPFTSGFLDFL